MRIVLICEMGRLVSNDNQTNASIFKVDEQEPWPALIYGFAISSFWSSWLK